MVSIGVRLLSEHFVTDKVNTTFDEFIGIVSSFGVRKLHISVTLSVIYSSSSTAETSEDLMLVIGIDEVNKIYEFDKQQFRTLVNGVGSIMCQSPKNYLFCFGTIEGPIIRLYF